MPQTKIRPKKDVSISQQRTGDAEKTILIADDDGDLVQMLALRCTQMGLHVFRSPDAMHALLGAHRIHPDLIVLDVNMPGGNGLSVCEMLAADETLGKTPVIIMTGDASEEIQSRCRTFHAEYVLKGAGLWEQLEPVIRRALGLPAPPPREKSSNGAYETDFGRRRPKILCIDDDPEISKILKFRLERYGVDVLRAFNGMQGYWTALDMRPDMIILDMVMPDGSGNYIFGRLRSHPLTEKVPVLMLTGVNTPGVRRQMFGLGVDAYLTKPVDFIALLEHVRQYVPLCDAQPATKLCEDADSHEGVTTEFLVAGLDQLVAK
jgi:DNA-binding response OmpR family regulator